MTRPLTNLAFHRAAFVCVLLLTASTLLSVSRSTAEKHRSSSVAQTSVDYLLVGGRIVDGTGSAARRADIGIRGERIAFIGNAAAAHLHATQIISAKGLIICPGLIDPHTHATAYLDNPARRNNLNYIMQGVTTVVTGNDGGGPIDVAATLDKWQHNGIGTNVALLVGFGTVRRKVMGMVNADPTPAQLDQMRAHVRSRAEKIMTAPESYFL